MMRTTIRFSGTELTLDGDLSVSEAKEKLEAVGAMPSGDYTSVVTTNEDLKTITFRKEVGEKG